MVYARIAQTGALSVTRRCVSETPNLNQQMIAYTSNKAKLIKISRLKYTDSSKGSMTAVLQVMRSNACIPKGKPNGSIIVDALIEHTPTRGSSEQTPATAHFEPIPAGGISEPIHAVQQAAQFDAGRPPGGLSGPIPGEAPIENAPTRGSNELALSASHFEPIPAGGLSGHMPAVQQASHFVACSPSKDLNEHIPGEASIEYALTRGPNEPALAASHLEPMPVRCLTGAAPAALQATYSEVHRPSGDLCKPILGETPIEHAPTRGRHESTLAAVHFEPIPARGIAGHASAVTAAPTVTLGPLQSQRRHSAPTQDGRDECETKGKRPEMNHMGT